MSTEFDSILPKGDFPHPVNIASTPHASVQRVSLAVQRGMSPDTPEDSGRAEIVDPSPVSADSVFERLRGAKTVTPELLAECARLWEDPSAVTRGTVLDAETLAARNRVGCIDVEDSDCAGDNLCIALATYFSNHAGRPSDDGPIQIPDGESG